MYVPSFQTAELITITPEEARAILLRSQISLPSQIMGHLERINQVSKTFVDIMARGEWQNYPHADPVAIDQDGKVLNGHHRLGGCLLSGRSVTLPIRCHNKDFIRLYRKDLYEMPAQLNKLFGMNLIDLNYLKWL